MVTRVPWKGEQETNPIRAVRLRAGINSQERAAELSGVPLGTIRRIERGQDPSADTLRRLVAFYGVSADVLLGLEPLEGEG